MKEKESRVRASVAWALGQIGDANAKEILTRAVNDENSLVRDAAAEALAKITEKAEKLAAGSRDSSMAHLTGVAFGSSTFGHGVFGRAAILLFIAFAYLYKAVDLPGGLL